MGGLTLAASAGRPETLSFAPMPSASFVLDVAKTGLLAGKVHHFEFTRYAGVVVDDPKNPARRKVTFTVQAASIVCHDTWINDKNRKKIIEYALGDNMLAAAQYPELRYVSTSVKPGADDHYAIHGMLTIRDKSRPVDVAVERQTDESRRVWWIGSATIRLSDFDLKRPTAALGSIGTKDDMQLAFRLS